jgi:quercetin dioxygenase-like cupin family protein
LQDDISLAIETILNPGSSFHVPVGLRHQVIALEDSNLFEFSTQHFEEDSYRIVKGD